MKPRPVIVVSATRFFQGGTLVIVNECLKFLSVHYSSSFTIKALVFKKDLYDQIPDIEWVEFPKSRASVFHRLYDEYIRFSQLAKKWQPVLWLSLQDSTPPVKAAVRAVYYHNTLLVKPKSLQLWRHQPRLELLLLLYKYVYTKGLAKNDFVITQQEMLAGYLVTSYQLDKEKVRIFPPAIYLLNKTLQKDPVLATAPAAQINQESDSPYTFIYPATAFYYKNHALIIEAVRILVKRGLPCRVWFTIDGTENGYVKKLVKSAQPELPQIRFLGFLQREELFKLYNESDCMVFPSLLESWGLPLTEFATLGKPILCADLPYGRATLSGTGYKKAAYFDPDNADDLATRMAQAIQGQLAFQEVNELQASEFQQMASWEDCFDALLAAKK